MATLTSTGVNCSNGTLDGFYTGTTNTNTTYPIGSYLLFLGENSPTNPIRANQGMTVYNNVGTLYAYFNGGTALAGTWRTRGYVYQYQPAAGCSTQWNYASYMLQRVA